MNYLRELHLYPKIPADLTEGTLSGGMLSILSAFIMSYMFIYNFWAYLTVTTETFVQMDSADAGLLRLNFNITADRVPCRFASVDVADVMGTHLMNVTSNVIKYRIDQSPFKLRHVERNVEPATGLVKTPAEKKREQESEKVPQLDSTNFDDYIKTSNLVLVAFGAPWCPWSQRLQPVWLETYEVLKTKPYQDVVKMATVDCTTPNAHELCHQHHVHAFPTIRIYRSHSTNSHENYIGDRTEEAFETFIESNLPKEVKEKHAPDAGDHDKSIVEEGADGVEGCQISGYLLVSRVPGNFHVAAHSKSHSFNAKGVNFTHTVSALSFGTAAFQPLSRSKRRRLPPHLRMDTLAQGGSGNSKFDQRFISEQPHQVHEHYIKVIPTTYIFLDGSKFESYQYTVNSHHYNSEEEMPAAIFSYNLSPTQVIIKEQKQTFLVFITQICAIIGGVFTVTGLVDNAFYHGSAAIKKKMGVGKLN